MSETVLIAPTEERIEVIRQRPVPAARFSIPSLPAPQSIAETDIPRKLLEDLALKTVYLENELTLFDLATKMALSSAVVEDLFQRLRKEQLCEVKRVHLGSYSISLTSQGKMRAQECLSANRYVGPAPVSFKEYVARVRAQSVRSVELQFADVQRALESLVLTKEMLEQLGIAVLSGTSIVLYGPTGTGKTSIAEKIPGMYGDSAWIPHAIEVDSQIITVYDCAVHLPVDDCPLSDDSDARWKLCERPRVVVGGELTLEMLDLQFNPVTGFYAAPLQMKAANGVLIVDDFGRQRFRPEELLNRWIVPLDRRIDFLTLAGGNKFEIPFDLLVVFATNLDVAKLGDEAFLSRIQNKIHIGNATSEQFHEIFRGVCNQFHLDYDPTAVDHFIEVLRTELNQPLRPRYARDIIQQLCWEARFKGKQPSLAHWATITRACRSYFLPPKPLE
jgi:predicted ATPase with chaperone activity